MQAKAPDGSLWFPNAATGSQLTNLQGQSADAAVQGGSSVFQADQANGNIDYYFSAKDRLPQSTIISVTPIPLLSPTASF